MANSYKLVGKKGEAHPAFNSIRKKGETHPAFNSIRSHWNAFSWFSWLSLKIIVRYILILACFSFQFMPASSPLCMVDKSPLLGFVYGKSCNRRVPAS